MVHSRHDEPIFQHKAGLYLQGGKKAGIFHRITSVLFWNACEMAQYFSLIIGGICQKHKSTPWVLERILTVPASDL
jgi:hypothetical protein